MPYILLLLSSWLLIASACNHHAKSAAITGRGYDNHSDSADFYLELAKSANVLISQQVLYDPSYFVIDYPNGDVPANKGVCTDVVIRALRLHGIDLQKLVHEDMKANFSRYPKTWGLKYPDKNIDHRRVSNLMTFFTRKKADFPVTDNPWDYRPGSIVCWQLPGGRTHIGMLSNRRSADNKRCLVIHNIGGGQVMEDCLFRYKIIGHYRYPNPKR
ncbi:DUF1287 domain-containing protein [Polluticaenibacter yanchengensis]|uniref:DUF1287 domain-containing protein n=1 Tax=Polluticaenibacter yanchengensis TaxID=3014562 RepID=A0ABT4UFS0_9BACT|nr:DUF1287 domain-containing protein [Chitinophagaceae bacterium LY-5]